MKKEEWNKKDRKLLAGAAFLVLLIVVLAGGLFVFQSHRKNGDISSAMAEALQAEDFPCLSGEDGKIQATSEVAADVLEKLPESLLLSLSFGLAVWLTVLYRKISLFSLRSSPPCAV